MPAVLVGRLFVPVVYLDWWVRTVLAVGRSLHREFVERGIDRSGSYGTTLGIALGSVGIVASALACVAVSLFESSPLQQYVVTFVIMLWTPTAVLWAVYWGTISNHRDELIQDDGRRRDFDDDDDLPLSREGPGPVEDRYR